MKPIQFPEANVVFAENQPEYLPLPAYRSADGIVVSCWKLTWRERLRILISGRFWFQQMTFGASLQPQLPSVDRPFK